MLENMALIPVIIATIGMSVIGDEPWEGEEEDVDAGTEHNGFSI